MFKKIDKNANRVARHKRVRKKVTGTAERPRLSVFRSSKNIYAHLMKLLRVLFHTQETKKLLRKLEN